MDQRPDKRRGPLLWLAGRTWRFWVVAVVLPLLYVASFGPVSCMFLVDGVHYYKPQPGPPPPADSARVAAVLSALHHLSS